MTAREMIHMLLELPPDMEIVIMEDQLIENVCFGSSQEIELTDEETGEKKTVFILSPCYCDQNESDECDFDDIEGSVSKVKANDFNIELN